MHTPPLILIADDEPDTADLLARISRKAGYHVEFAQDGQEAVERTHELMPDLILLDIQMPKMTGLEVLKDLRDNPVTALVPIIIITAAATKPEDAAEGLNIGADDYIIKPFNFQELMARMRAKVRTKELEERLQNRSEELDMLVRLGADLNKRLALEPLAKHLLRFLGQELSTQTGLLFIRHMRDHAQFAIVMTQDRLFDTQTHDSRLRDYVEQTQHKQERLLSAEETRYLFDNEQVPYGIVAPIHYDEEFLGILAIGRTDAEFSDDELQVMRSVNQQVSLAVHNAQLHESLRAYADELENRVEQRTAQLKDAQEQLVRSEKLASLGRLAAEIAHEVNNPLQSIMTNLEGVIEDTENNIPVDVMDLTMAIEEVRRLRRTVERLQAYARPGSGGTRPVKLDEVLNEVLTLTHKKREHLFIHLTTNIAPNVPVVQANPDQLKQVFLNMIINAMDGMSELPSERDKVLTVTLQHNTKTVDISFEDNGSGIDSGTLAHIFEPFVTTKENGSGLGLAISHSIIEAHGGMIDVQSEVGKGTLFLIRFPHQNE